MMRRPLIDADDPKSELFLDSARLTELPFPARHLVDVDSYHYSVDGVRALSLIAQLGCPFECGFCGGRASPSLRRVRMRTTQSVVEEIVHLHQTYGVNGFMLYDDELNVNPKMIELMAAIAAAQRELQTDFRLRVSSRRSCSPMRRPTPCIRPASDGSSSGSNRDRRESLPTSIRRRRWPTTRGVSRSPGAMASK